MDSNQNAARELRSWIMRMLLAISLGIALMSFVGATAWSAPYTEREIRSVMTERERQVQELRDQEINQLRIALGRRLEGNRRADLYLRLAEIYVESYRAAFLMEGRVHEKKIEKGEKDRYIDRTHSKPYLLKGIQACQDILKLGIRYEKMDNVYYFLAFYNEELERRRESLKYYELLTRKHPNSRFVVEAYRALGEEAFEKNQFRRAQAFFEQAVKVGTGDGLPRALHKLAWAYYRTKLYDRAVDTMKLAIERSSANQEKFLSLREEALRDMAVFMTETGRVEEAIAYFDKVAGGREYYATVLEKLGKQYERAVQPKKAAQVYESILKVHGKDEAGFRVLVKLVDLDLRSKQHSQALRRLQEGNLLTSGDVETRTAAQNLRAMVRRTATEHHEKYRKKKAASDLKIAENFYSVYLDAFLSKEDPRNEIPEIRMYLAEVKRELGKSEEASLLYRSVVASKDKRYAKEAAALWTASLSEEIRKATQGKSGAADKTEPSKLERDFIDAADHLQEALADSPEGREAALKAAQVLAGYPKTHDDALERAMELVKRSPDSSQAVIAARLQVQLIADQTKKNADGIEDLDRLRKTIEQLSQDKALLAADRKNGGKLAQLIAEQQTRVRVNTIARHEKNGDFASAARGYEAYAGEATQRDAVEKAFSNAVTSYVKAADFNSAERVAQQWLKRYPGSKEGVESLRILATQALILGSYNQSAELFEKIGRGGKDAEALETAALIFEGSGDAGRARQSWYRYLKLYPKSARRAEAALALGRLFDALGQEKEAASWYKYCGRESASLKAECGVRLGDLYLKLKDTESAEKTWRSVAALKKTDSVYVGYARYRLAEQLEAKGRFEKLALPDSQLKKAVTQRLEYLEPLSRAYNSAVDAGGPWAVAALDRLALWAVRFADELDAVRAPATATPEAVAEFKKSILSVSQPLRQKAVSTWQQAWETAVKAEILSPTLPEIADRLVDARVPGIGRSQGQRGGFRLAGVPSDGGKDGREKALASVRQVLAENPKNSTAWIDYGNLLWGEGRPLLAKLAYDRSLALDAGNAAALNNRGALAVSGAGQEDWLSANEGLALFQKAMKQDEFFLPAKINRALLLNYYHLFPKARPLWEQVLAKGEDAELHLGLAVSLQGVNESEQASKALRSAGKARGSSAQFVKNYLQASQLAPRGEKGAKGCLSRLRDAERGGPAGFEQVALENLKRRCGAWKEEM